MNNHLEINEFDTRNGSLTFWKPTGLPMLWRRWHTIVLGMLFCLQLGIIYYKKQPDVYKSTAQVLTVRDGANMNIAQTYHLDDYVSAQSKLITSPLIVKRAVDEEKLWRDWDGQQDPTSAIVESLLATVNGNILTVSFEGPNPKLCRDVLKAIITSYEGFLNATMHRKTDEAARYITGKAEKVHKKLEEDRIHYAQLQRSLLPISQAKKGNAAISQDFALTLKKDLLPLRLKEQMLLEKSNVDHPYVQRLLRSVRGEIELKRKMHHSLFEHPDTALPEMLEKEQAEAERLADLQYEIEQLDKQIARNETLHSTLMNQLQQINLGKEFGDYRTRLISPATLGVKFGPNAEKILGSAAIWGILMGIGLAYVVDITDKSFHNTNEICDRLGLPVISQVPLLKAQREGRLNTSLDRDSLDPMLLDYRNCASSHAEAFRRVRMALLFGVCDGSHQVIQITSPNVGDGKSTIAGNLAVSMAQAGKKTLLIDANLRRPQIHTSFGLLTDVGLATVLAGDLELRDVIQDCGVSGLTIVPCGYTPSNPAELLTSPRFASMIESARLEYEIVIVDTPALLDDSDPCVVAHIAGKILLAIRLNPKSRLDAEKAIETMGPLAAKLTGVIINNMDGRWRTSSPNLLSANNRVVGHQKELQHFHLGHKMHLGNSPSNGTGGMGDREWQVEPAATLQRLEHSIQQLQELIANSSNKKLTPQVVVPDQQSSEDNGQMELADSRWS